MAYRKKYKPYILKYKALILKYMPCIFRLFFFFEKQILIPTSKRRCRNAFLPPVSLCVGLAVWRVAHGFRYQPNRQKNKKSDNYLAHCL